MKSATGSTAMNVNSFLKTFKTWPQERRETLISRIAEVNEKLNSAPVKTASRAKAANFGKGAKTVRASKKAKDGILVN